jgi:hypothetical protein
MATLPQTTATIEPPAAQLTVSFEALFRAVPPVVRGYMLSATMNRGLEGAYKAAGLDDAARAETGEQVIDVFLGVRPLKEFPDALWSALPWDAKEEPRARKLSLDILGYVFLPARRYLGDVAALIKELGGKPEAYPQGELPGRDVAYEDAVLDVLHIVDPSRDMDLERRDRLATIIEAQLRGMRSAKETAERLMRTAKTGGMEFDEQQANAVATLVQGQQLATTFHEDPVEATDEDEGASAVEEEEEEVREYSAEEIRSIYAGSIEEQDHIRAAVSAYGNDGAAAAAAFAPAAPGQDPWSRLGATLALAQSGKFMAAAKSAPAYLDAVRRYLAAQRRDADMAAFAADPVAPMFLGIYLQLVFKRYCGFADNASARYAVRMGNLLKKAGTPIPALAAFDPTIGDFRWVDPM